MLGLRGKIKKHYLLKTWSFLQDWSCSPAEGQRLAREFLIGSWVIAGFLNTNADKTTGCRVCSLFRDVSHSCRKDAALPWASPRAGMLPSTGPVNNTHFMAQSMCPHCVVRGEKICPDTSDGTGEITREGSAVVVVCSLVWMHHQSGKNSCIYLTVTQNLGAEASPGQGRSFGKDPLGWWKSFLGVWWSCSCFHPSREVCRSLFSQCAHIVIPHVIFTPNQPATAASLSDMQMPLYFWN